jgi:hypothetical protein
MHAKQELMTLHNVATTGSTAGLPVGTAASGSDDSFEGDSFDNQMVALSRLKLTAKRTCW